MYTRENAKADITDSCGEGWLPLVDEVYDKVPQHISILLAYQKYAGLKFDTEGSDEAFEKLLDDVYERSRCICEICGSAGDHSIINGWETALCTYHYHAAPAPKYRQADTFTMYKTFRSLPGRTIITVDRLLVRRCSRINQCGGDYVVDYTITAKPNDTGDLNILFEEDEGTLVVIAPISEGIENCMQELSNESISLKGIDLVVSRGVYHITDYHPSRYRMLTAEWLKEWLLSSGVIIHSR
jgi:hypothetical protein